MSWAKDVPLAVINLSIAICNHHMLLLDVWTLDALTCLCMYVYMHYLLLSLYFSIMSLYPLSYFLRDCPLVSVSMSYPYPMSVSMLLRCLVTEPLQSWLKIPWPIADGETWTHDLSWTNEVSWCLNYAQLANINHWMTQSLKDHLADKNYQ